MQFRVDRLACPLLLLAVQPTLDADVLIKETLTTTAGGRALQATRTIEIKGGERMRIAVEQDGQPTVTLFDLPAGVTIALEAAKRRASVPSMAARATELENNVPRARVTTTMTVAGAAREIAGVSCQDHRFTIRVPATTDGDQIVVLAGTACVAPAAPFSSKNEASRANGSQVARSPKRLRALNVQGKTAMVEQAEFRLENRCGCCVI